MSWQKTRTPSRPGLRSKSAIGLLIVLLVAAGCSEEENDYRENVDKEGMVLIPAGDFGMGDHYNVGGDDERPAHTVYLDDFYIDRYEVNNSQYARFLNKYGKNADAAGHELLAIASDDCLIQKAGDTYKPKSGYEDHPAVQVSWYGAAAYAQFYGKRLPAEAEWEKAARGRLNGRKYSSGDSISHDDANYEGIGGKDAWDKTAPVGSFAPNGYGLFDVSGNVCEWCADEYDSGYYSISPESNPRGPGVAVKFEDNDFTNAEALRVLRGGCWYADAYYLRVAYRSKYPPSGTSRYVGFRCAAF